MRTAPKYRRWILGHRLRGTSLLGLVLVAAPLLHAAPAAPAAPAEADSIPQLDTDLQDIPTLESLAKAEAARQFPSLTDRQRLVIGPIERSEEHTSELQSPDHLV